MPQQGQGFGHGTRRRWCMQAAGWVAALASPHAAAVSPPLDQAPAPIAWPSLSTVEGRALLPAHWQGVPTIVVFWATWCGYCRRHNAHVDQLYRSVDAGRLRVLGVALDSDAALVRRYLRQTGYGFPTVADGTALRRRFTERRVIPMTCTLGADGRLQQAIPGEMSEADVLALARLALPPR